VQIIAPDRVGCAPTALRLIPDGEGLPSLGTAMESR
jgi:hypothetical protein